MLGSVAAAPCCVSWRQRRRQAGHCACSVIPECKLHLHHCFAVITAALKAVQAIPKRSALRLVACRKDCVLPHLYSARNAELQAWQPREGPQTVLKEPCRHRPRCCPPPLPQTPVQAAKQTICRWWWLAVASSVPPPHTTWLPKGHAHWYLRPAAQHAARPAKQVRWHATTDHRACLWDGAHTAAVGRLSLDGFVFLLALNTAAV